MSGTMEPLVMYEVPDRAARRRQIARHVTEHGLVLALAFTAAIATPGTRLWTVEHLGNGPAAPVVRWAAQYLHLGPTAHVTWRGGYPCLNTDAYAWGMTWGAETSDAISSTLRRVDATHAVMTSGGRTVRLSGTHGHVSSLGCAIQ